MKMRVLFLVSLAAICSSSLLAQPVPKRICDLPILSSFTPSSTYLEISNNCTGSYASSLSSLMAGGNAGTATAFATTPTLCSTNQATKGIDVSGNAQGCITPFIATGLAGGQTLICGTAASNTCTITTTSNGTKGKATIGGVLTADEANARVGVGTSSPSVRLQLVSAAANGNIILITSSDAGNLFRFFELSTTGGLFSIYDASAVEQVRLSAEGSSYVPGNFGIATQTFGTSAVGVLGLGNATAPSTSPANITQIYSLAAQTSDSQVYARNEAGKIQRLTGNASRTSAQFDKTTTTTLANITGLSVNVDAGKSYKISAEIPFDAAVAGGSKFAIAGTTTATSITYQINEFCDAGTGVGTLTITSRLTALAGFGANTGCTSGWVSINGLIVVNAAGTLTAQFAQNVGSGTSSVLVNATLVVTPIGD